MKLATFALLWYGAKSRYPVMQPETIPLYLDPVMPGFSDSSPDSNWDCPFSSYVIKKIHMLFTDASKTVVCGLKLSFELNAIQQAPTFGAIGWPKLENIFGCSDPDENVNTVATRLAITDEISQITAYRDSSAVNGILTGLEVTVNAQQPVLLGNTGPEVTTWQLGGQRFIGAKTKIAGTTDATNRIVAFQPSVVDFNGDCNKMYWSASKQSELDASLTKQIEVIIGTPGYSFDLLPQSPKTIMHCQWQITVTPSQANLISYIFPDGTINVQIRTELSVFDGQSKNISFQIKYLDQMSAQQTIVNGKNQFKLNVRFVRKGVMLTNTGYSPFGLYKGKLGTDTTVQSTAWIILQKNFYKLSQIQFASRSATQSNGFMLEFTNYYPFYVQLGYTQERRYYGTFYGTITTTIIPADRDITAMDLCFDPAGSLMHIRLLLDDGSSLKAGLDGCAIGPWVQLQHRFIGFYLTSEHDPNDLKSPNTVRMLKIAVNSDDCKTTSYNVPMGNKDATNSVNVTYKRSDPMGVISLSPMTHTLAATLPQVKCTPMVSWRPSYFLTVSADKLSLQYQSSDFYSIGTTSYKVTIQDSTQANFYTGYTTETMYVGYRSTYYTMPPTYSKKTVMISSTCFFDGIVIPPTLNQVDVKCFNVADCYFKSVKFVFNNGLKTCSLVFGPDFATADFTLTAASSSFNNVFFNNILQDDGTYFIGQIGQGTTILGSAKNIVGTTTYKHTFYLTDIQYLCGFDVTTETSSGIPKMLDPIMCSMDNKLATTFTLNLTIQACGATCSAFTATKEYVSQVEFQLMTMNAGESGSKNLWDNLLSTTFDSSAANTNPYLTIDFMTSVTVGGVYIHTNEAIMVTNTGNFNALVGDTQSYNDPVLVCADMSNVGKNSIGGVFNCNRQGRYFMIYCFSSCKMSISMIRIWQSKALSHLGTITHYSEFKTGFTTNTNLNLLTKTGSLSCATQSDAINIQVTGGSTPEQIYFQIDLGYAARVSQFLAVTWQEESSVRLFVSSKAFDQTVISTDPANCYTYDVTYTNSKGYTSAPCVGVGRYVAYWRTVFNAMSLCKLVVLGTFCHEEPLVFSPTDVWPTLLVDFANVKNYVTPPVPNQGCVDVAQQGYTMAFLVNAAPVTWLTYDSVNNQIVAFLNDADFNILQGNTFDIQVTISRTIGGGNPLVLTPMQVVFAGKIISCGASCPVFDKNAEVMRQLQPDLIKMSRGEPNSSFLNDLDLKTSFVSDPTSSNPFLMVNFVASVKVEGVLIHTDEALMKFGSFIVEVLSDTGVYQSCPMGGVGVGAIGGVFNCGLEGIKFKLTCTGCQIAIKMLYIWQMRSLGHEGDIKLGNRNVFSTTYPGNTDLNKLIGLGSYSCIDRYTEVNISKGTGSVAGYTLDLKHNAWIDQFLFIRHEDIKGTRFYADVTLKDISLMDYTDTNICWYSNSPSSATVMKKCQRTARYIAQYETNASLYTSIFDFLICKVVVIGQFCHHMPLTFTPALVWPVLQVQLPDVAVSASVPTPDAGCTLPADQAFTVTFTDLKGGPLPWLTYDSTTNSFSALVKKAAYMPFNAKTITYKGTYQRVLPDSPPFEFQGTIVFADLIDLFCRESTMLMPAGKLPDFVISVNQPNLQRFILPEVQDLASIETGDTTGVLNCGPRLYSYLGNESFLWSTNAQNPLEITVASYTPTNQGFHGDVAISVSLYKYAKVVPVVIPFTVKINPCVVLGIVPEQPSFKPSAIYIINQLPYTLIFTRYITYPDCFYIQTDFTYTITLVDGQRLPQWATLDQSNSLLELIIGKKATDQTIEFIYQAQFMPHDFSVAFKFSLLLKTGNRDTPAFMPDALIAALNQEQQVSPLTNVPVHDPNIDYAAKEKVEQKITEAAVAQIEQIEKLIFKNTGSVDTEGIKALANLPIEDYVNFLKAMSNIDSNWTGWTELLAAKKNKKKQENQIILPPYASISHITSQGLIVIKFTKPMLMISDLSRLFTLDNGARRLASERDSYRMDAQMIPSYYSDATNLGFNYTAQFKDEQTLHIQMYFSSAEYVSSSFEQDQVKVHLSSLLLDSEDGLPLLPESQVLKRQVPPQMVLGASATTVQVLTTSMQVAATTAVAGNAALNIFLQGSLNQLWGMINNIQMIVVTPLISVQYPGNALNLYAVMIQIATFDILPTDKFFPKIFPLPEDDGAFNDRFDNLGFGSIYFAGNFGSALIGLIWMFFLYITYPIVVYFAPSARFIEKYRRGLKKQLFWNTAILFIQEAYLDILICVLINICVIRQPWVTWTVGFSAIVSMLLLVCCIFLPLFTLFYIRRNFELLETPKMKDRYESIYEMVDLKAGPNAILWCVLFFVRRAIFACSVVLSNQPVLQLMAFVYPAVMVMIWLGQYHPLSSKFDNNLELYDSCSVVVISYCLFLFTDFVPDAGMRYKIGWVMLLFTLQNIVVNLYLISKQPIIDFINKTKKGFKNRKALKHKLQQKLSLDLIRQKSVNFLKQKTDHIKKRIFEEDSPLETISEVSEQEKSVSSDESVDEEEKKAIQQVYDGIKVKPKIDDGVSSDISSEDAQAPSISTRPIKSQAPYPQEAFVSHRSGRSKKQVRRRKRRNRTKRDESRQFESLQARTSQLSPRAFPITKQTSPKSSVYVPYQPQFESQSELKGVTDFYKQTLANLQEKAARMSATSKQRAQRMRVSKLIKTGSNLNNSIDEEIDFLPKHDSTTRYANVHSVREQSPAVRSDAWAGAVFESQKHVTQPKKKKVYVPSVVQLKKEDGLSFQKTQLMQNWQPGGMEMPVYKPSYTKKGKADKKLLWQQYLTQDIQTARVEGRRRDTDIQSQNATPDLDVEMVSNVMTMQKRLGLKKQFKEDVF